ncbi:MAG: gamma-glutamyltransferase [Gammaproteobacteria bacterium]|nr:MAG: gamma-glutamyltransferase [Gammaproteobacteria bacterium]
MAVLLSSVSWASTKPVQPAVATAHPLATQAALAILAQGGNAFDAAIAATAALAVVEPYGSGLGGGGFYLLRDGRRGKHLMLDAREVAPLAAYPHMYLHADGSVDKDKSINGPLAAGIPGIPAALQYLAAKRGKLPLAQSLAPAIQLAEQGFAIDQRLLSMLGFRQAAVQASPAAAGVFLNDGELPKAGALLVQKDLANTLQALGKHGAKGFYQGEIAKALVEGVQQAGGIWTLEDLAQYRVQEREVIEGEYRGMRIVSAAPPSSGGVALLEMLNTLAQFDMAALKPHQRLHLVVEAMRRAYRDRAQYLGDPDYVSIPVDRLTSPLYAAGLAASIREDRATLSRALPGVGGARKGEDTTHFSILDTRGNMVAATLSINYPFGSGFMPPGTGVLLNDEMDDFAAKPNVPNVYGLIGGAANQIEPGKRMLSSMSPTIAEYGDRIAVLGTPGGSRIISMVLLALLDFRAGGDAESMTRLPRFHHQFLPDVIQFEPAALDADMQLELQLLGHEIKSLHRQYGNMQVVLWDKATGKVDAASDPRGIGRADLGSYAQ